MSEGSSPRVFLTRKIPPDGLQPILAACQADVWPGELPPPREELMARVCGVDGLLCLLTDPIDEEVLQAAGPQLRVVSQMAVGTDNVDVAACTARGIPVGHTPGVLTETTADLALALLLAAARRLPEAAQAVRQGEWVTWSPLWLAGRDVHGATVGIVGLGRIGMAVARRLQGFGCRILYHSRRPLPDEAVVSAQYVDLPTLLAESDFVTLHAPLTEETHHLMNATRLALMKSSAILVNTARGGLVDQEALYAALAGGQIAAAALDVTDPEPMPPTHPLLDLPNCLVVPHIASASVATRNRMAAIAAQNLLAGLRGEPLGHCVNKEVYGA